MKTQHYHRKLPEPIEGFILALFSFGMVGLGLSLALHFLLPFYLKN